MTEHLFTIVCGLHGSRHISCDWPEQFYSQECVNTFIIPIMRYLLTLYLFCLSDNLTVIDANCISSAMCKIKRVKFITGINFKLTTRQRDTVVFVCVLLHCIVPWLLVFICYWFQRLVFKLQQLFRPIYI